MTREEKAWRSLCGGKPAPKVTPGPVFDLKPRPEPPLLHPERLTDPHWQRKRFKSSGYVDFLRRHGLLLEERLNTHYALLSSQATRTELDPAAATVAIAPVIAAADQTEPT